MSTRAQVIIYLPTGNLPRPQVMNLIHRK